MVSIHTNLSSLIAQNSLNQSTNKLNQAIERMSTGYKINHAGDNAANYSIATDMSTKLNAYQVAEDNVSMGMELLSTAQDTIQIMSDNASRLYALCMQARNGTYGATSLSAINTEAASVVSNIMRLYTSTEYNGISLYDRVSYVVDSWLPQAGESGFIDETAVSGQTIGTTGNVGTSGTVGLTSDITPAYDGFIANPKTYTDEQVAAMTSVSAVTGNYSSGTCYKISSAEELAKLATDVNSGKSTTGATFVLASDIDLSAYSNWTPIGTVSKCFSGNFDGNGHKVSNLKINRTDSSYQGLFGYAEGKIKNIGVVNCDVSGYSVVGGLVGCVDEAVTNSYVIGNVSGTGTNSQCIGGLVGYTEWSITNSYVIGNVSGTGTNSQHIGGLVGETNGSITNCYTTGSVSGSNTIIGGLAGFANANITNSYATGAVSGTSKVGGLVGEASVTNITNSYATGAVSGTGTYSQSVGGLVGYADVGTTITSSYATGAVTGDTNSSYFGGLVGYAEGTVTNSYATGAVTGNDQVGGLVGYSEGSISNSYAIGNVLGTGTNSQQIGGLVGYAEGYGSITKSYATGTVSGNSTIGGLVGANGVAITNSYATGAVTGTGSNSSDIGGLVGYTGKTVTNSYATGNVSGKKDVGGLVGYANGSVTNSYASGGVSGTGSNSSDIGGLVGLANGDITNSYAIGNVSGNSKIGGLVGYIYGTVTDSWSGCKVSGNTLVGGLVGESDTETSYDSCVSYSKVYGDNLAGSFIGGIQSRWEMYEDGELVDYEDTDINISINNCKSAVLNIGMIGGGYINQEWWEGDDLSHTEYVFDENCDISDLADDIAEYNLLPSDFTLQIGIGSARDNQITVDTNFSVDLSGVLSDISSDTALKTIQDFLNELSSKATEIGSAQNRLDSALESIGVNIDNLTSSRSTLKDADIAKVSSQYIQQQILQQASATLLSTANQSPAIALQLI